jgi:glycosyltransferase involved in cell wall biosynthesis
VDCGFGRLAAVSDGLHTMCRHVALLLWNGLMNFHPNRRLWKERYYKNLYAFSKRSRNAVRIQNHLRGQVDMILQLGVLFDAHWSETWIPNVIYTDYTARLSAASIYHLRSPLKGEKLAKWLDYETNAYRRAAHIFTRSEFVRQNIIQYYGIPPERVNAVGGGVNFDPFPTLPDRDPGKPPVLLFIGSEFSRKGGDLLLRAFEIARRRVPNAHLRLLTRDPIPTGFSLENVEILPFIWDRARICQLYAEADIFVLPSRQETWGDVILEAAAYALPSIGVAREGMGDVIHDGKTGLLAPPENIEAMAATIVRLLENVDLRLCLGRAARIHTQSNFTWDKVVERMRPVIESIMSKKEKRLRRL